MILQALKVAMALATIAAGAVSLAAPRAVVGFTGLEPIGGRGLTEIRAVLGGLFLALGAAPFVFREPLAYRVLGLGYLTIGAVRLVSIFVDRSAVSSNWISLGFELVAGVILIL